MERLTRTLQNNKQLPVVRLADSAKINKVQLRPISRDAKDNCKSCIEKDAFAKSLQAEIYRLQVFFSVNILLKYRY